MKKINLVGTCLLLLLFISCSKKDTLIPNHSLNGKTKQVNWTSGSPLTNGVYVFKNANGQCFQVGTAADGAPVQQNTYIGLSNQQWDVTDLGGGYYKIANHYSGKVLDVPNGATTQNLQLQQWTYLNTDNQKWAIVYQSGTLYKITNKGNMLSVTLDGNSPAQFTKISQTTYVADAAHRWIPTMVHLPRIGIYASKFYGEAGAEFKILGVNYDRTIKGGLLEDRWDQSTKMDTISQDFAEMKALGANVVRLHLQFNKFMTSATQVNTTAINHLLTIVGYAEANKMYLIITGLGSFRASDQPSWYTNMTQTQRWAAQYVFWEAVAGALANNPTIFGYDLMNEPVVPATTTTSWLPGPQLGGYDYVQNITRDGQGSNWAPAITYWIADMTNAIRAKDTMTPISVGFLPFTSYAQFTSQLDYASVHIYPTGGQEAASLTTINGFTGSKPLVIEEFFPLLAQGETAAAGQTFVQNNKALVSGWVSFYWGDTIAEQTPPPADSTFYDKSNTLDWMTRFQSMSTGMKTP